RSTAAWSPSARRRSTGRSVAAGSARSTPSTATGAPRSVPMGNTAMRWPEREEKGWGAETFTVWHLLETPLLVVRVHRILEPNEPVFSHSHPRHLLSVVLWGKYFEHPYPGSFRWRRPGSFAWYRADDVHRVWHPHGQESWSLAIFLGRKRPWRKDY